LLAARDGRTLRAQSRARRKDQKPDRGKGETIVNLERRNEKLEVKIADAASGAVN
jgi:hypothetical protein